MGVISGFLSSFSSYISTYHVSDTKPGLQDATIIKINIVQLSKNLGDKQVDKVIIGHEDHEQDAE